MLLPSAVSNPASMMAQALTMYKSLIGNVSNDGSPEISSPALTTGVKGNASSGETGDESGTTANTADRGHLDSSTPRFSLQSPDKEA